MYQKDGNSYFIVDGHVHIWDARASNLKNIHGKQFIDCFYDYHRNLSPEEVVWDYDTYTYYGGERLMRDLFAEGYVDHAIFQATLLSDFYVNGFGQTEEAFGLAQKHPDKLTYNHAYDPRNGEGGLAQLRRDADRMKLQGVKLYTAEWHGDSRGYKLDDPWSRRYLEECINLGIKNIHVHKGPTIRPLDRDAFDVADVDKVATDYLELNFIVEHAACPGWRTSVGSPPRSPTCTAAWPWRFRSSTPGHGISRRSSASCCTGSARTRSCSPVTMRCGRRSGSSSGSSISRSPRT